MEKSLNFAVKIPWQPCWGFTYSKLGFLKHPMKMGFCKAIHEIGIW